MRASLRDAAAGAAAGALAKTAVAPVERVKLLMQLGTAPTGAGAGAGAGGGAVPPGWTAWEVAGSVLRNQGPLAFWRGNAPNVVRQAGAASLNFLLMDRYKAALAPFLTREEDDYRGGMRRNGSSSDHSSDWRWDRRMCSSLGSAGLAGGTATTVLYPVEFLRTRLALDAGAAAGVRRYPRGMRDVLGKIWTSDGIRGLYQGYGIALAGVVVYRALHLGGYDLAKAEVGRRRRRRSRGSGSGSGSGGTGTGTGTGIGIGIGIGDDLTLPEKFATAQVVSMAAGTVCYPLDSVRRRLMMQAGTPVKSRPYRNSLACFRGVWRSEGVGGFFLGIGPNLVRSFGGAVLLVGYDVIKGMIGPT